MKIFIDTANVDEIKEVSSWGILSGVTTNPTLIAREGKVFEDVVEEITNIVDGPISAEVTATDSKTMILQARELSKIHKNIVIKVPITEEGLKCVSIISKENIKTNVTLIFSASQALLAARAGATYVSPFLGRLDDIGESGVKLIESIVKIFRENDISTEIIAASIRNVEHIEQCAKFGCDIATVPYKVLKEMVRHDLTDKGIEKFLEDFKDVRTKGEF